MLVTFEKITRVVFLVSLLAAVYLYFIKDSLPEPSYYDWDLLREPLQSKTRRPKFFHPRGRPGLRDQAAL